MDLVFVVEFFELFVWDCWDGYVECFFGEGGVVVLVFVDFFFGLWDFFIGVYCVD